ncbi:MAG: mycothiol system anti-sigma-R factor [Nitriliruptorales bacterium]|nr:mycothiol system anti-sigma-R factor [Nitriliruptorales bacterium]
MSGCEEVDCQKALEDLQLYLDGELPASQLTTISDHLAKCYPCTDRATFEQQLRALVRRGCADRAPSSLVQRIEAQLDALSEGRA